MQRDSCSSNGGINAAISSPLKFQNERYSSPARNPANGIGFTSLYSSIFSPKTSLPNSVSPSSCDEENNAACTGNRLYLARLTLEYQQLVNRYGLCLGHLQEAAKEAEALREENDSLRLANNDLTNRLSLLAQTSLQNRLLSSGYPSLSVINDFRSLCVGDNGRNSRFSGEVSETSPTSVITNNRFEKSVERVSLPKSISIRSSGYLGANQASGSSAGSNITNRLRVASSAVMNKTQHMYVGGGGEKKEEEALELEVYNQGMLKTELCNKWQESGSCPYGEQCQFAHGISELRPVIRHPRYKTEVCRMVLSGDTCPYGHRCHFRHALTEQERLMSHV